MSVIVEIRGGESLEKALKVFKRKVMKAGTLKDLRRHRHYTKPSMAKRLKAMAARRRLAAERGRGIKTVLNPRAA